jgi:MbtH protein
MGSDESEESQPCLVLVNEEEQYCLWRQGIPVPGGWRQVKEGSRSECLAYVQEIWTDMRPLSLRRAGTVPQ